MNEPKVWEICKLSDGYTYNEWVHGPETHRAFVVEKSELDKNLHAMAVKAEQSQARENQLAERVRELELERETRAVPTVNKLREELAALRKQVEEWKEDFIKMSDREETLRLKAEGYKKALTALYEWARDDGHEMPDYSEVIDHAREVLARWGK